MTDERKTTNPPNTPTPSNDVEPTSGSLLDGVGGRKFALAAIAIVALLLGSWLGMDDTTKQYVMWIALGGTAAIAGEKVFTNMKGGK